MSIELEFNWSELTLIYSSHISRIYCLSSDPVTGLRPKVYIFYVYDCRRNSNSNIKRAKDARPGAIGHLEIQGKSVVGPIHFYSKSWPMFISLYLHCCTEISNNIHYVTQEGTTLLSKRNLSFWKLHLFLGRLYARGPWVIHNFYSALKNKLPKNPFQNHSWFSHSLETFQYMSPLKNHETELL